MFARRTVLAGLAAAVAVPPALAAAKSQVPAKPAVAVRPADSGILLGSDFGIVANVLDDQSGRVQAALNAAHDQGQPLLLPGGQIFVANLEIPGKLRLLGQPGSTVLIGRLGEPVGSAQIADDLVIDGVGFAGMPTSAAEGLLIIDGAQGIRISNCRFLLAPIPGIVLKNCEAVIEDNTFDQLDIAVFSHDSRGLNIANNTVTNCANGGILIWRESPGTDGSVVIGNRITGVLAKAGGNGQHGNGINVFNAEKVVVSNNVIADCDFSAIRANTASDAVISANVCSDCREVAIYSEFAFSGSVISGNIIDGAAAGISITNFDQGGKLAICSGNIVRNITPNSPTNPDVRPFGISAEAYTVISGNTVTSVPGIGIAAGYGAYLSNVVVADNIIADVDTGIAVTVADGAGAARIAGNMISGARISAIAGMRWQDVASADLVADAGSYPQVSLEGNVIGR